MPRKEPIIIGTRARVQRISDAKILSGWLHDVTSCGVTVRTEHQESVAPREMCVIEAYGHGRIAQFQAVLAEAYAEYLVFDIVGAVSGREATEPVRIEVDDYQCRLRWEGASLVGTAFDISHEGIGLRIGTKIPRGAHVVLEVHSSTGQIGCVGDVRYCKALSEVEESYRIGLRVTPSDRINIARWKLQFDGLAA